MKMVNTVELKNRTNAILRDVSRGQAVIVTLRGKPVAALTRLTDAGLEEFVLLHRNRSEQDPAAAAPSPTQRYRYLSLPSRFGEVYVAYGSTGPAYVTLASSPAAFEQEVAAHLGSAPAADPTPPEDLRSALVRTIRDHAPYRGSVDLAGVTAFERDVLHALRRIPRGRVRTYGEIARELGKPGAARAVGTACARNPLPLLIPCHRVVRGDGTLGGYSMQGGTTLKRALLETEGALPAQLPLNAQRVREEAAN